MCFERGTGQSLEWRPRLEGTRAAQDPEQIAARLHAIGYSQGARAARVMQQKRGVHIGHPSRIVCSVLAIANAYSYIPLTPDAPYRAFWTAYGRFLLHPIAATTGRASATPKSEYIYVIFMFTFIWRFCAE